MPYYVRWLILGELVIVFTIVLLLIVKQPWIGWVGMAVSALITAYVFARTAQPPEKKYPSTVRSRSAR